MTQPVLDQPCFVCDKPITDDAWDWAAMKENGRVHHSCFMTDDELRAQLDDQTPCSGCETLCTECQVTDMVEYADGVNNATIIRDHPIVYHRRHR